MKNCIFIMCSCVTKFSLFLKGNTGMSDVLLSLRDISVSFDDDLI